MHVNILGDLGELLCGKIRLYNSLYESRCSRADFEGVDYILLRKTASRELCKLDNKLLGATKDN